MLGTVEPRVGEVASLESTAAGHRGGQERATERAARKRTVLHLHVREVRAGEVRVFALLVCPTACHAHLLCLRSLRRQCTWSRPLYSAKCVEGEFSEVRQKLR